MNSNDINKLQLTIYFARVNDIREIKLRERVGLQIKSAHLKPETYTFNTSMQ